MNAFAALPPVVLIGSLQWLMPSLVPPTLPFGVRVPLDHADAPVITVQRRRYRIATAIVAVAAAAAVLLGSGHAWALSVPLGGELLAGVLIYLVVRRRIIAVKSAEDWFGGRRQVTVADTSLRTDPERYPWPWSVPAILLTAGTVVAAVVEYPRMPTRLPAHFGASGADRYAAKSVASVFGPVLTQVAVTLLLLGLAAAALYGRAQLDAEDPRAAARHRRFVAATARALLVLAACTSAMFLVVSLSAWQVITLSGAALTAFGVLLLLLGVAVLLVVVVRTRPGGGPRPAGPVGRGARAVNRDDDRNYRWGLFYFNRDDPSLLVPKRFGIGWTLNLARPGTWLIFGVLVVVAVIPALFH
ncbi:MAG TPA: DUF5808 domain-containing protein [Actinoallomurus sp.]|nr:DUF5808 domain-containing protein [Actinoallomurus sp.]